MAQTKVSAPNGVLLVLYISDSPVFNAFDPCAGYLLYMMEIQQILQHDLVHVRYRCTGRQYFRQGLQYGDLPAVFRQVKRQFTAYKSASDDDRMVSGSDLTGKMRSAGYISWFLAGGGFAEWNRWQ